MMCLYQQEPVFNCYKKKSNQKPSSPFGNEVGSSRSDFPLVLVVNLAWAKQKGPQIFIQCMKPSLLRRPLDRFPSIWIFRKILASEFSSARIA